MVLLHEECLQEESPVSLKVSYLIRNATTSRAPVDPDQRLDSIRPQYCYLLSIVTQYRKHEELFFLAECFRPLSDTTTKTEFIQITGKQATCCCCSRETTVEGLHQSREIR
ncbi:hypothetical protein KP79_PYT13356 [Mizuhopecten yessoensis]|uniref:Uncharacterized protein n=1 Tax=Mizuhopecten yessoensis TaxID=6573 RepID=A0A210PWD7_MIZYE|nr:hypothetical protein KP79_PYT13356 [Mizuhopecten yessoensis]